MAAESAPDLRHVSLMQGYKVYGAHLGPFSTPARESDPPHMPPEFNVDQQHLVEERAAGEGERELHQTADAAGGKEAKVDRVEWLWIPDMQTAVNALINTAAFLATAVAVTKPVTSATPPRSWPASRSCSRPSSIRAAHWRRRSAGRRRGSRGRSR